MRAILASLSVVAVATAGVFMHQKTVEVAAFMSKLEEVSTFEIQASEMASERAHAATVKSFAQRMIEDHIILRQQFEAAARGVSPKAPTTAHSRHEALLAKLRDARGKAFDHTFIHAQLQIHKEALSLIRSYSESGRTLPLRDFAKNSLPMLEHHLSMARQLTTEGTGGLPMRTLSAGHGAPIACRRLPPATFCGQQEAPTNTSEGVP